MNELTDFFYEINWSFVSVVGIVLVIFVFVYSSFKIIGEYERLAVFFQGCFYKFKGPGLVFIVPNHMKLYRVRVGVQGVLMAQDIARFNDIDLPVRPNGKLKLGDSVQVTGFEDRFAIVDGASSVQMKRCPECGHEFY